MNSLFHKTTGLHYLRYYRLSVETKIRKKNRSTDPKTINFTYLQVAKITLNLDTGSCGCAGKKKMKVRVLGF